MYLEKHINPIPIILSIAISFMGSYATITMYEQFRLCYKTNRSKLLGPNALLFLTAICSGSVAVWTMHFMGVASITLTNPETNERQDIFYSNNYLIISFIIINIMSYLGLILASSNKIYTKDKTDAIEEFIRESKHMSIQKIRNMNSKYQLLQSVLLEGMTTLVMGGIIAGSGICIMYYISMEGLVFNAHIEWNYGIVAASVVIGLIAAIASFWILFRLLSLFPYMESLRVLCSILMCIAINGMHCTGMAAASFVYFSNGISNNSKGDYVSQQDIIYGTLAGASILISFILMLTIADLRSWYYNLSGIMNELDKVATSHLKENDEEASIDFIHFYVDIRRDAIDQNHAKQLIKSRRTSSNSVSSHNNNIHINNNNTNNNNNNNNGSSKTRLVSSKKFSRSSKSKKSNSNNTNSTKNNANSPDNNTDTKSNVNNTNTNCDDNANTGSNENNNNNSDNNKNNNDTNTNCDDNTSNSDDNGACHTIIALSESSSSSVDVVVVNPSSSSSSSSSLVDQPNDCFRAATAVTD